MNKASVDAGRVSLPTEMVKLFGDPTSREDIPVWLFLIDPGHLRVMSESDVREILGKEPNKVDSLALETREQRERLAALRMRLFQTSITPVRRLKIPAEAFEACEEELNRRHVWIDGSASFVDVYMATYRNARLATPSDRLFIKSSAE